MPKIFLAFFGILFFYNDSFAQEKSLMRTDALSESVKVGHAKKCGEYFLLTNEKSEPDGFNRIIAFVDTMDGKLNRMLHLLVSRFTIVIDSTKKTPVIDLSDSSSNKVVVKLTKKEFDTSLCLPPPSKGRD